MKRLIVAVALVLAGCAAPGVTPAVPTASPSTSAKVTSPSASASGRTATVAQYASLIARNKSDYVGQIDKLLDSRQCAITSPGHVDVPGSIVCSAGIVTLGYQAETLSIILSGAMDPTKPKLFIGEPPAEIKSLIAETITASQEVKTSSEAASACATKDGPNCTTKLFTLFTALKDMRAQFDAWKPFGV